METLTISWVVAEKLLNHIEIAELLPEFIFFFTRKNLLLQISS